MKSFTSRSKLARPSMITAPDQAQTNRVRRLRTRIQTKIQKTKASWADRLSARKKHASNKDLDRSNDIEEDAVIIRSFSPQRQQTRACVDTVLQTDKYAKKRRDVTVENVVLHHQLQHNGVDVRDFQIEYDQRKAEEDASMHWHGQHEWSVCRHLQPRGLQ